MFVGSLPVPASWKKLLRYDIELLEDIFCWRTFLETKYSPYCMRTLISLPKVRYTIDKLNWNYLKTKQSLAVNYLITQYSKVKLMEHLETWSPVAETLIYQIQRMLCSIEIPRCLNKNARRYFNYKTFIITNPNPLSMYVNCPKIYFP